jgi:hypothetical protein
MLRPDDKAGIIWSQKNLVICELPDTQMQEMMPAPNLDLR